MSLENSASQLEKRIIELEDEDKRLHETVAYLTRKLYGSSSENTSALGIEDQMFLFNEAETKSVENAPQPTLNDVINYRKKRFKGQREELLKNLPRERRFCTLAEEDRDWLSPVIDLLPQRLLKEQYLHYDETPVQVLQEPDRKNTTASYMWVYSTAKNSKYPIRFFEYQPRRGGKYPQAFLQDFKGYLHTDAYAGYNKVAGVIQRFCWSHVRRKFADALSKNIESPEATIPAQAIGSINKLFKIKQTLEGELAEKRQKERLKQSKPELEAFGA